MDYQRIVQCILDVGESMSRSGAENFRIDDTLYRICRAYGFVRADVFAIPSNIQITVETEDGEIITQIRHIESSDTNYDRLDYLNNLSRYICKYTPDADEFREKYEEVMHRPDQPSYAKYVAGIMGGTGFAVFFGCNFADAIVAVIVSFLIIYVGGLISKRENNLLVHNFILAFMSETIIINAVRMGLGQHPERIMIGIVMLLISALGTTNGIRELIQRDYISGGINILNSILGASGIALGIMLAMMAFGGVELEGFILNHNPYIQLISCTVACTGFALWFKVKGRQIIYSGIGAFFTWLIYMVAYEMKPSNFLATLLGAAFVAIFAFAMARVNKAPMTIFLTASAFPLIPGPNLYYMMYGYAVMDKEMIQSETFTLFTTCIAIALGFLIVDILIRNVMGLMKQDYFIGKGA